MPTLLLTCFEPFGGDVENASQTILRLIESGWAERRPDVRLVTAELPVAYRAADERVAALLAEHRPDFVVALGEAGYRATVTPEALARNLDDARIPDNDGGQPCEQVIDPDGDDLPSRMDVVGIVAAGQAAGLPIEVSDDAGGFLCNHVFYRLMQWTDIAGGFIHVPAWRAGDQATIGSETDSGDSEVTVPAVGELIETVQFVIDRLVTASGEVSPA